MELDWADYDDDDTIEYTGADADEIQDIEDEKPVVEDDDNAEDDAEDDAEADSVDILTESQIHEEFDLNCVGNQMQELFVVPADERRSSHWLSEYEITEIISIRGQQIAQYSNCLVDVTGLTDPRAMAWKELLMRKTPLVIRRKVGERRAADGQINTYYELWRPYEMSIPPAIQSMFMRTQ